MTLLNRAKSKIRELKNRLKAYFKRLLFPLHLFPLKLVTYSLYYLLKFLIGLVFSLIKIFFECLFFPFRSLKNFLKSLFIIFLVLYIPVSLFVMIDYLSSQYGYIGKFFCAYGAKDKVQDSVVRIVGGNSEGSGFFIKPDQVITNFHVIDGEPSPKIIFPDGTFITPVKITGTKEVDLALLYTDKNFPEYVLPLPNEDLITKDEPLLSTGYPLGTSLTGRATTVRGNFIDFRQSKKDGIVYIQTNISVVSGMSGGPLTDQCGKVVGINTQSLAGLSLFVSGYQANHVLPGFSDQNIKKIVVNPSLSPEESVKAFYTYLKARNMSEGFKLLSTEYLKKTNYEEWTHRFRDVLDVEILETSIYNNTDDTVFVKFSTKIWDGQEVSYHYYEGTWQTILEDGIYKMLKSSIKEVIEPEYDWFY
jgi:hypothetical protein